MANKVDVSKIDLGALSIEELEELRKKAQDTLKEKRPKPLSVKAKINAEGVEKHVTAILQNVKILIEENALDAKREFVTEQLARLNPDVLEQNAMNTKDRAPRGKRKA